MTVDKERYQEKLEFIYDLFPRLEERKKQIAGSLSGGERQMLSISRALMSEPSLLMLDEPSFGLAPKIVIEIFHVLEKLNKETGLTMLLVEQNVKQALKIASRAMVIEAGYEVTRGTPEEILNNKEVIEAYLG
jgi:branched-chain amino acid transport system ATP-binding protein